MTCKMNSIETVIREISDLRDFYHRLKNGKNKVKPPSRSQKEIVESSNKSHTKKRHSQ